MSSKLPRAVSVTATLRTILQTSISFAVIIYAIGFVVANSFYSAFGITEYQLIQARYIGAGLAYLFFHLGLAAMVAVLFGLLSKRANTRMWLLLALSLWFVFVILLHYYDRPVSVMASTIVNVGVIVLLGYRFWLVLGRNRGLWLTEEAHVSFFVSRGIPLELITTLVGIATALIVVFSALTWSRSFWPIWPSTLGGGKPSEAVFVFDADNLHNGDLPLVPMQSEFISEQLPVLYETSDSFLVVILLDSGSQAVVRIGKSVVSLVIYAPSLIGGGREALPTMTRTPIITPTPP